MTKPLTIGLTGSIGAGKSTAAEIFRQLGAEIVSGDELGKLVLEQDFEVLDKIRERFGVDVFDEQGKIKRRELGQRVFLSQEYTRWLTRLTFPGIYQRWKRAVSSSHSPAIVLDAALIAEWGIQKEFDILIAITAPLDIVFERAGEGRFTKRELEERTAVQMSLEEKSASATAVIENTGSKDELRDKIHSIWKTYIESRIS